MEIARRILWIVLFVAVCLYLGVIAWFTVNQRRFFFHPGRARPDAAAAGVASLREVTLDTADGLHLLAWYVPPMQGLPVICYFHGNGGNLDNRVDRIRVYAAAGYGLLMVEYRGYGGNAGIPSDGGFAEDARAAMRYLEQAGFGPGRIVVYGESIGTGVATRIASERRIAALVLEAPFTSVVALAQARTRLLPVGLMLRDRFDSLSRIGKVTAPILMLRGDRDGQVPRAITERLFAAAPEPKEMWVAPEGAHSNLLHYGSADATFRFLQRWVPAATP